jgi:nucleoside-diphosphate-sugar epimerase
MTKKRPNFFITGATGLVGSHLLVKLIDTDLKIHCLIRSESSKKKIENLFRFYFKDQSTAKFSKLTWINGSLNDPSSLEPHIAKMDYVVHAAGMVSFSPFKRDQLFEVNTKSTEILINLSLKYQVKHFIHVSSTAVFANAHDGYVDEQTPWEMNDTTHHYAESKYNAEVEVRRGSAKGLCTTILNPAVILGPGDYSSGSSAIFGNLKKGMSFYPKGSTAFVDARDIANFTELILDRPSSYGERYILSAYNASMKEQFEEITKVLGVKAPTKALPKWVLKFGKVLNLPALVSSKLENVNHKTLKKSFFKAKYKNDKSLEINGFHYFSRADSLQNVKEHMKWIGQN